MYDGAYNYAKICEEYLEPKLTRGDECAEWLPIRPFCPIRRFGLSRESLEKSKLVFPRNIIVENLKEAASDLFLNFREKYVEFRGSTLTPHKWPSITLIP